MTSSPLRQFFPALAGAVLLGLALYKMTSGTPAEQAVPQTWEGYRLFEDAAGRTIAVYTSAYARFADREIPAGECSLTGVLEYGTAGSYGKQFILQMRDENDCTH